MKEKGRRSLDRLRKMIKSRSVYYGDTKDTWHEIRIVETPENKRAMRNWCKDNAKDFYGVLGRCVRFRDEKDAFRFRLALGNIIDEGTKK